MLAIANGYKWMNVAHFLKEVKFQLETKGDNEQYMPDLEKWESRRNTSYLCYFVTYEKTKVYEY